MASGAVRCAISGVIEDKNMDFESPRIKYSKNLGNELLHEVIESEQMVDIFDKFSTLSTEEVRHGDSINTFHIILLLFMTSNFYDWNVLIEAPTSRRVVPPLHCQASIPSWNWC